MIEHPSIHPGEWPMYTYEGQHRNRIELGYHKCIVPDEKHWILTLCHEVNHWAQVMFLDDDYDTLRPSRSRWVSEVNVRSGGYGMLERAANWGVRPPGLKNVVVQEVKRGELARPIHYRRVKKRM